MTIRSHFSLFWANTQFALSETAEYNQIKYNSYYKRRKTKAVPINQFSCLVKLQNLQERFWKHDPSVLIFKNLSFQSRLEKGPFQLLSLLQSAVILAWCQELYLSFCWQAETRKIRLETNLTSLSK